MSNKPIIDLKFVARTLRDIIKQQTIRAYHSNRAIEYIYDHKLVKQTQWPSYLLSLTEAGVEFLNENSEE
jgi:hypothetical protein